MSDLAGATALVTGGAGFVGSHLAAALCPDTAVRVLDDCSTGARANVPDGATLVEGDVRDPATVREAVAGVDVVFHEAAVVSVERSVEAPLSCHAVNVDGTLSVLEAAREADARVVFASSAAVYGPSPVPVAEDARPEPRSPYGCDKLAADRYCRLYDALYDAETVVLRYFNVYGPGRAVPPDGGVVRAFVERALAGDPLTVHGDGTQTRDFVHVDDVVRANLRAATVEGTGEAYNVGTGESVSVRELADIVASLTPGDVDVETAPPRGGDLDASRADVRKAREALGFEAETSLREGLRDVVADAA